MITMCNGTIMVSTIKDEVVGFCLGVSLRIDLHIEI